MISFEQWLVEASHELDQHSQDIMRFLSKRLRTIVNIGFEAPSHYDGKEFWHVLDEMEELIPDASGQAMLAQLRQAATKILEVKSRYMRDAEQQKIFKRSEIDKLTAPYQQEVKPLIDQCYRVIAHMEDRFDYIRHTTGIADRPQFQKHADAKNMGAPFGALPRSAFGYETPKAYHAYNNAKGVNTYDGRPTY